MRMMPTCDCGRLAAKASVRNCERVLGLMNYRKQLVNRTRDALCFECWSISTYVTMQNQVGIVDFHYSLRCPEMQARVRPTLSCNALVSSVIGP